MTLLDKLRQALYDWIIVPTVKKESDICLQHDALAWERYHKGSKGQKSKFNYSILQKRLKTNTKNRDFQISKKTAKWNWLKP